MGWVWLDHPDLPGGPERFPDDETVLAVAKSRGFVEADDPEAPKPGPDVEPDEVDIHGQGWVYVRHSETGGDARVPVEVLASWHKYGWEHVAELEAAAAKKKTAKKKTAPVEPTPEEK
jgi:hypothetical protein